MDPNWSGGIGLFFPTKHQDKAKSVINSLPAWVHRLFGVSALAGFTPDAQHQAQLTRWSPSGRPIEQAERNIEQALLVPVDHLDMSLMQSNGADIHDGDTPPTANGNESIPSLSRPVFGGQVGSVATVDDDAASKILRRNQVEETRGLLQECTAKLEAMTDKDSTEAIEVKKQIAYYSDNLTALRATAQTSKDEVSEVSSLGSNTRRSYESLKELEGQRAEAMGGMQTLQESLKAFFRAQGKEIPAALQGNDNDSADSRDSMKRQMASLQEAISQMTTHVGGMSQQPPAATSKGSQPDGSEEITAGRGENCDPVDPE